MIDVSFDVLRDMAKAQHGSGMFYQENDKNLIIYKEFNGMLFRNIRIKSEDNLQNEVWKHQNMPYAFRIETISNFGEAEWKAAFGKLYAKVEELARK